MLHLQCNLFYKVASIKLWSGTKPLKAILITTMQIILSVIRYYKTHFTCLTHSRIQTHPHDITHLLIPHIHTPTPSRTPYTPH